jgi:acyl-CoA reductase-like NAD-dependent aldehyde dehydrogenase
MGQVKDAFLAAVKKLKMGNPFEEDTYLGPMISESAAKGIEDWVKEAVEKGGKLLTGGSCKGPFMEPTVLEDVPMEAYARKEEIFGPVVLLYKYKYVPLLSKYKT